MTKSYKCESKFNSEEPWVSIASQLAPGDKRPDISVSVSSDDVLYACELSSSFGMFTLTCNDVASGICNVLDVVLKKDDGWSSSDIVAVVHSMTECLNCHRYQKNNGSSINLIVTGYLERTRSKSSFETAPICLHAKTVYVEHMQGKESSQWEAGTASISVCNRPTNGLQSQLSPSHQNGGWRGAKDDTRFSKFALFLLETFGGYEALSCKPVLDIAGGAGGLAFELSVRHSIHCIIVDNKLVRFKSKQMRHVQFRQSCVEKLLNHNGKSPLAKNLLQRFQVASDLETLQLTQLQTLLQATQILSDGRHVREEGDQEGRSVAQQRLSAILRNKQCSVICGMHPDEATDEIIDVGLAMNIPWAVVPCCVFPNLFRSRVVDGRPVRSYEDYCAYIRSRSEDIRETELPFRGRNMVFFWIPPQNPVPNN
ncbi:hypothetical protein IV203_009984 [Nitzschia inconspicua]|uniref:Uncharacterized protein n=1 Tax=Nitzschia inconspicua TaxID=303405 RepID=A0A9K3PMN7_9STRA|nr:hypothetical protein IV203_009984 [Nitzschia inconspicua]